MIRIITSIVITILSTLLTIAQPTANSANVSNNFTAEFLFTDMNGFAPGPSGANQTWDFSSLNLTVAGTSSSVPVNTTPYASIFSASNYCIKFSGFGMNTYNYQKVSPSKLELLSTGYSSLGGKNHNPNPRTFVEFPYTYLSTFSDIYETGTTQGLSNFTATYDGYGTIILPFGTYTNVIRQKIIENGNVDYVWFNVNPFFPILQTVSTDNVIGVINHSSVLNLEHNDLKNDGAIYPNPSNGIFHISWKEKDASNASIQLYDSIGKLIYSIEGIYGNSTMIDLSACSSGLYFLKVFNQKNQPIYSHKIIKI